MSRRTLSGAEQSEEKSKGDKNWFFYAVRCADNSLYIGITNDLVKREQKHNQGIGSNFTNARRPVKIVYSEKFNSKSEARKREWQVKRWARRKKENLVKGIKP